MNIFILDNNIEINAQFHCDKHLISQIKESAQILSTICKLSGIDSGYKPTHIRHPCIIWCGESLSNWLWLKNLIIELNNEYRYRYDKNVNHKSFDVAMSLPKPEIKDIGATSFVQVMPKQYKDKNPVIAYRNYYIYEKQHVAYWKNRNIPYWYKENQNVL